MIVQSVYWPFAVWMEMPIRSANQIGAHAGCSRREGKLPIFSWKRMTLALDVLAWDDQLRGLLRQLVLTPSTKEFAVLY